MPLYYSVVDSLDLLVSFFFLPFFHCIFFLSLDSISALLMLDEPLFYENHLGQLCVYVMDVFMMLY